MTANNSDKKITLGRLSHFAERYTSEVLNPALNTYSEAFAHDMSLEDNALVLKNSTGDSLASVALPSACRFNIEIVSELPENPDPDTLYFIQSGSSNDPENQELTGPVRVVTYTPNGNSDNPLSRSAIVLNNGDYASCDVYKVQAFNSDGTIKATFGDNNGDIPGDLYGTFANLSDMCRDSDGYLYVIWSINSYEGGNNTIAAYGRITKLSYDGTSFHCVSNYVIPCSDGLFQPKKIIYSSARNKLLVARYSNVASSSGIYNAGDIIQVNMDFSGYARISPEEYLTTGGTVATSMAMTSDGLCLYVATMFTGFKKLIYDSISDTTPSSVDTSFATIFPGNEAGYSTYKLYSIALTSDDSSMLFSRISYASDTSNSGIPLVQKIDLVGSDHAVENIQEALIPTEDTVQYISDIVNNGNDIFTYAVTTSVSDEITDAVLYKLDLSAGESGSGSNSGTVVEPVEGDFSDPVALYTTDNLSVGTFIRLSDGKYAYIQREDQNAGKSNSVVFLNADGTVAGTHVFDNINGPYDILEGPDGYIYVNENPDGEVYDNWYLHKYRRNGTSLSLVKKMTIPYSKGLQIVYNPTRNNLLVSCSGRSPYNRVYLVSLDLSERNEFIQGSPVGLDMTYDGLNVYYVTNDNDIYLESASSLDENILYKSSTSMSLPYSADLVKSIALTDDDSCLVYASDSMRSIYKRNISTEQTSFVRSDCLVRFLRNNGGDIFTWGEENTSAGTVTFYRMDM